MSAVKGLSLFRQRMPLSNEYAKTHGWVFEGQRLKSFVLNKNGFRYHTSITPSDPNADKQVVRQLKHYDATGDVHGRTEKTNP